MPEEHHTCRQQHHHAQPEKSSFPHWASKPRRRTSETAEAGIKKSAPCDHGADCRSRSAMPSRTFAALASVVMVMVVVMRRRRWRWRRGAPVVPVVIVVIGGR